MNVAVVGASDKPDRYSYRAVSQLVAAGHTVFAVHPRVKTVQGLSVYHSLSDIPEPIHTVTLYVSPHVSSKMETELLALRPRRVIFNPGTENRPLMTTLLAHDIAAGEACTLVLLSTSGFADFKLA
jgi:predicted CoA-binding protein